MYLKLNEWEKITCERPFSVSDRPVVWKIVRLCHWLSDTVNCLVHERKGGVHTQWGWWVAICWVGGWDSSSWNVSDVRYNGFSRCRVYSRESEKESGQDKGDVTGSLCFRNHQVHLWSVSPVSAECVLVSIHQSGWGLSKPTRCWQAGPGSMPSAGHRLWHGSKAQTRCISRYHVWLWLYHRACRIDLCNWKLRYKHLVGPVMELNACHLLCKFWYF